MLYYMLSSFLYLVFSAPVGGNLSPLCCGDNFCCAISENNNNPICWGGNSMSSKVPTSSVKALTCGGKAVMGIDSNSQVSFYVGTNGYGPDHPSASSLVGVEVKDADLSFWGGAILKSDGTIVAWGPDIVYCNSASGISCQPTSSQPTSVNFALTNVPLGTTSFTGLSCGGKRGGHWCCAYQIGRSGLTCFGDSRGEYTPTTAQLNNINFDIHQISASVNYVAVLGSGGQLGVYGSSTELGNGLTNKNPSSIADLTMNSLLANDIYAQVSTMNFAIYAMKSDGTLHVWGKSYSYSVGGGGSVDMAAAVPSSMTWGQLSNGNAGVYAHFCALRSDNIASCWGADYSGQVSNSPSFGMNVAYTLPALLSDSSSASTSTPDSPSSTMESGTAETVTTSTSILGSAASSMSTSDASGVVVFRCLWCISWFVIASRIERHSD